MKRYFKENEEVDKKPFAKLREMHEHGRRGIRSRSRERRRSRSRGKRRSRSHERVRRSRSRERRTSRSHERRRKSDRSRFFLLMIFISDLCNIDFPFTLLCIITLYTSNYIFNVDELYKYTYLWDSKSNIIY